MNTEGVVVTGSYDVVSNKYIYNPSKNSDIKRGDIIIKADGNVVSNINDLTKVINDKTTIQLDIIRDKELILRNLDIYEVDNIKRSGLYVKDKVIGVGTITYIDPNELKYGALGHEVIDNDTYDLVRLKDGIISYNDVISITKGSNKNPGEKISETDLNNVSGDVLNNSKMGIFGKYISQVDAKKAIPIAFQNEVKKGKAKVLTCISGDEVKEFDIEITDLKKQNITDTKGITFKIIDDSLLNISGGVYSGMSGSPIIQNNHIIGSVTHVLVDNIKYGYGLYIENMYNHQKTIFDKL
jgi:stage IV sporulation protein B